MRDLYAMLEYCLEPEDYAQTVALERCGQATAEWLDFVTDEHISEDAPEEELSAVAGCLAELAVLVYRAGGGSADDLPGRVLIQMEAVVERRLGRYGLL